MLVVVLCVTGILGQTKATPNPVLTDIEKHSFDQDVKIIESSINAKNPQHAFDNSLEETNKQPKIIHINFKDLSKNINDMLPYLLNVNTKEEKVTKTKNIEKHSFDKDVKIIETSEPSIKAKKPQRAFYNSLEETNKQPKIIHMNLKDLSKNINDMLPYLLNVNTKEEKVTKPKLLFTDILYEGIEVLKTFHDDDLRKFAKALDSELRKHNFAVKELLENKSTRRYVFDKLDLFQKSTPKEMRQAMETLQNNLIVDNLKGKEKTIANFLNIMLTDLNGQFKDLIDNLKSFKENKDKNIKNIVTNAVRDFLLDPYNNLPVNLRKEIKNQLDEFVNSDKSNTERHINRNNDQDDSNHDMYEIPYRRIKRNIESIQSNSTNKTELVNSTTITATYQNVTAKVPEVEVNGFTVNVTNFNTHNNGTMRKRRFKRKRAGRSKKFKRLRRKRVRYGNATNFKQNFGDVNALTDGEAIKGHSDDITAQEDTRVNATNITTKADRRRLRGIERAGRRDDDDDDDDYYYDGRYEKPLALGVGADMGDSGTDDESESDYKPPPSRPKGKGGKGAKGPGNRGKGQGGNPRRPGGGSGRYPKKQQGGNYNEGRQKYRNSRRPPTRPKGQSGKGEWRPKQGKYSSEDYDSDNYNRLSSRRPQGHGGKGGWRPKGGKFSNDDEDYDSDDYNRVKPKRPSGGNTRTTGTNKLWKKRYSSDSSDTDSDTDDDWNISKETTTEKRTVSTSRWTGFTTKRQFNVEVKIDVGIGGKGVNTPNKKPTPKTKKPPKGKEFLDPSAKEGALAVTVSSEQHVAAGSDVTQDGKLGNSVEDRTSSPKADEDASGMFNEQGTIPKPFDRDLDNTEDINEANEFHSTVDPLDNPSTDDPNLDWPPTNPDGSINFATTADGDEKPNTPEEDINNPVGAKDDVDSEDADKRIVPTLEDGEMVTPFLPGDSSEHIPKQDDENRDDVLNQDENTFTTLDFDPTGMELDPTGMAGDLELSEPGSDPDAKLPEGIDENGGKVKAATSKKPYTFILHNDKYEMKFEVKKKDNNDKLKAVQGGGMKLIQSEDATTEPCAMAEK